MGSEVAQEWKRSPRVGYWDPLLIWREGGREGGALLSSEDPCGQAVGGLPMLCPQRPTRGRACSLAGRRVGRVSTASIQKLPGWRWRIAAQKESVQHGGARGLQGSQEPLEPGEAGTLSHPQRRSNVRALWAALRTAHCGAQEPSEWARLSPARMGGASGLGRCLRPRWDRSTPYEPGGRAASVSNRAGPQRPQKPQPRGRGWGRMCYPSGCCF